MSDVLRSRIATLKQAVDAVYAEGCSLVDAQLNHLTIHFVGSDETECPTSDSAALLAIYRPLVEHVLSVCGKGLSEVNIVFIGPNHPLAVRCSCDCDGVKLTFDVYVGLYHQYATTIDRGDKCKHTPALVACFNAGLWGYNDWLPTLQLFNTDWLPAGAHLLVTAYTLEEGEDDEDVLAEHCPSLLVVVPMQENRQMASQVLQRKSAAEDRTYIDSQMWMLMKKT